ncbi:hypothetical protein H7X46_07800 [Pseudonocardia sp. C8]|uniref:hypothetical protein n=1 Tax=Pseudonocardia sp. C8 TaxID=2762759 RepID=UPI001642BDCD|nr:hypothetical protein [Pseudonocardia sp. C8]MBC3190965.1 hypothetical protein [Pseudonocardia sp. C8]
MVDTSQGPLRIELRETGRDGIAARQARLPATTRQVHRAVLSAFLTTGQAPHRGDLGLVEGIDVVAALRQLDEADLVHTD